MAAILHRMTDRGNTAGWCGATFVLGTSDCTWELLDPGWNNLGYARCQTCLDMHGDVLQVGSRRPDRVMHAPSAEFLAGTSVMATPYRCGSAGGPTTAWSSVGSPPYAPTEERCRQLDLIHNMLYVPCRRCIALCAGLAPAVDLPSKPVDDGFNGNCRACGKRTYEGATPSSFEHEGGPCAMEIRR